MNNAYGRLDVLVNNAGIGLTGFVTESHPLVWRHESGRRSLILAYSIPYFLGMDQMKSDDLLAKLLKTAEEPQYIYTHDWQVGDLLIWDNTGTMHRVVPFDLECGRELQRVTLLGEESIRGVKAFA